VTNELTGIFVNGVINKLIEDSLRKGNDKQREIGVYYPSELPFCLRRNFYLYNYRKDYKLSQLKVFEAGNLYHDWFNNLFERSDFVDLHMGGHSLVHDMQVSSSRQSDTPGEPPTPTVESIQIRGRFDDFIYFKLNKLIPELELLLQGRKDAIKLDSFVLLEVKTMRSITYLNSPKLHNVMQLNFYMKLLNVLSSWIVYVDRRDLAHRVFEVQFNERMFNELLDRAKQLHTHLKDKTLPRPEARLDPIKNWECTYCDFREECIKNKGGVSS
jgi:CRISPR/Cas system-associated exonuclease Cas4 (RecB family)